MQLNSNNFIRWYSGTTQDEQSVNLPRLGITDAKIYMPCVSSFDATGFYINADVPFYDNDAESSLQLQINGTPIATTVHKVQLLTGYRLYADFTFPAMPEGEYYYTIYNTATNTVKCISNYFRVINTLDAALQTVFVEWRNSRDAFLYDWSLVPDLTLKIRLNLSLAPYQVEGTVDQTKAVSTGQRRNNNFDLDLGYKLQTYYFDDGANLACYPLFTADTILLNGRPYIQKSLYSPNVRVTSGISIGEVDIYDRAYSTINKYGQLPQLYAKKGRYVLINNTGSSWVITKYAANGTVLGVVNVLPNTIVTVPVSDLQTNGYVKTNPSTVGSYNALIAHTLPDSTYAYSQVNISSATPGTQILQNAIYNNDYIITVNAGFVPNTAVINLSNDETSYTPRIDSNARLNINGVDQAGLVTTTSQSYTVNGGDTVIVKAYCQETTTATNPKLYINMLENGAANYSGNIPATNGAELDHSFTVDANARYDISVYGQGS